MAKDSKVIQRGVNVQANDLAVPAGTTQHAVNIDNQRDGVAARRVGFAEFWTGLPQYALDTGCVLGTAVNGDNAQRGTFELFSRDHLMCLSNGMIFSYVDDLVDASYAAVWKSVPSLLSHRFRFHGGTIASSYMWFLGKLFAVNAFGNFYTNASPFSTCEPWFFGSTIGTEKYSGAVTNSTAQASVTAPVRYYDPFDAVNVGSSFYLSDNTTIRKSDGSVLAGSITATGSTDGVGAAARFNGASWMATDNTNLFVADNVNEIRKIVVSTGSVTTLAGSTTAGDTDGVGTAARFRTISGLAYNGGFLYVSESAGHRIRKVDVTTGSVTIFAGLLSPATSGYVDAVGTAARFNTPTGIEYINGFLYTGDSGNKVIREIKVSDQNVISYTFNTNSVVQRDGMIGGLSSQCVLPGVIVRGKYSSFGWGVSSGHEWNSGDWLSIECTTAGSEMIDLGLVAVTSQGSAAASTIKDRVALHYARCPANAADPVNGPMKLDTAGPNAYSVADVRGVDVGFGCMFNTREYPRSIDAWTKQVEADPMPRLRPIGIAAPEAPSCTTVGSGSIFVNNTSWAYRTLCGLSLSDGRVILGPPSERIIVTNTSGGTVNGSVTAYPSAGLPYDAMAFVQVYRTKTFSSSVDPGDQMFLAYEAPLTYGNGVLFADTTPDALLGAELYTNQTQPGGFGAAALRPPLWANEIAAFNNRVVVANYIDPATIRIKVLGTSPLVAGTSTITFSTYGYAAGSGLTFTAISGATAPASRNFQIGTGGSAAQNAAQTARNIVYCINRCPDAFMFTAMYDENDPGSFVVTSLFPGLTKDNFLKTNSLTGISIANIGTNVQSTVSFSTNAATAFMTIQQTDSTRQLNSVAYSDVADCDSFLAGNKKTVGPATESIVRTLPISDRLVTIKDDSVWALDVDFSEQIYDKALSCILPNSFASVNNQWIGLFTRGFVALNATQATAIGRPIDRDVSAQYRQTLLGVQYTLNFARVTYRDFASAAAIDLSGNYLCTFNKRTYCYNAITGLWSEWAINSLSLQTQVSEAPTSVFQQVTGGVRYIGAYRDRFIGVMPEAPRGVFLQRSWRDEAVQFGRDFSDMSWLFSATLASNLSTASVASYSNANNPGIYPPFNWTPPQGAVSAASMNSATALWMAKIEQSGNTAYRQCTVVPTTSGSSTSPVTITLTQALSSPFVAGAATVTAYAPEVVSVQWAPTFSPGVNSNFNEALVSMERSQPGYLVQRYFNRVDTGSATVQTSGLYDASQGVSRAILMSSLTSSFDPATMRLAYSAEERFDIASERSYDQQLAIELWEAAAWQALAIKSIVIDHRSTESGKTKQ